MKGFSEFLRKVESPFRLISQKIKSYICPYAYWTWLRRTQAGKEQADTGRPSPHKRLIRALGIRDVLLHALCDAILGAAGLKDIGFYFSNKDVKWKDISSILLLKQCAAMIAKKKLKVGNVDITVIFEEPKISPYIDQMKVNISKALKIKTSQIAIKSTTSEGLGFVTAIVGIRNLPVKMTGNILMNLLPRNKNLQALLLCLLSGALLGLSFPPFKTWFLVYFGLAILLYITLNASRFRAGIRTRLCCNADIQ